MLSSHTARGFFWQLNTLPSLSVEKCVLLCIKTTLLLCVECYKKTSSALAALKKKRGEQCDSPEWHLHTQSIKVDTTSLNFLEIFNLQSLDLQLVLIDVLIRGSFSPESKIVFIIHQLKRSQKRSEDFWQSFKSISGRNKELYQQ